MWKNLRATFVSGLLTLLPVMVTIFILVLLYQLVGQFIGPDTPLGQLLRGSLAALGIGFPNSELAMTLMSMLGTLLVIFMVGLVTRYYLGRLLYSAFERAILSVPLLRAFYKTIKQITDAAFDPQSSVFKRVVLVEYPRKGAYHMGFLTNESVGDSIQTKLPQKMVSVFIMAPPNPMSGFWVIAPREDVIYLDLTVEEGLRMVMSRGISLPQARPPAASDLITGASPATNDGEKGGVTVGHAHLR
jgi:uncharacterized membrane protein